MAQYTWTAIAADDGQLPSNMGFTYRWVGGLTVTVENINTIQGESSSLASILQTAGYDAALSLISTEDDNRAISFDSFDGVAIPQDVVDVEIYVEQALQSSVRGDGHSLVRGRDDDIGRRAYGGNVKRSGSSPQIVRYNPDFAVLAGSVGGENFELVASRFRVNGSSLKIKTWEVDNETEPGWQLEITDGDIAAGGWIGYQKFGGHSTFQRIVIPFIGIGTNGDPAPTAPVPVGPTTPTGLITSNITANSFRAGWTP